MLHKTSDMDAVAWSSRLMIDSLEDAENEGEISTSANRVNVFGDVQKLGENLADYSSKTHNRVLPSYPEPDAVQKLQNAWPGGMGELEDFPA